MLSLCKTLANTKFLNCLWKDTWLDSFKEGEWLSRICTVLVLLTLGAL